MVAMLEPDLTDFYETWCWLTEHPYFRRGEGRYTEHAFYDLVDVIVVKINPATGSIDDDPTLNTQVEFWLEACTWEGDDPNYPGGIRAHDWEMDVAGPTYEEAILALGRNVMERIGSYPAWRLCSHCLVEFGAGPTDDEADWFCSESCEACGPYQLMTRPVPDRDDVVEMIPAHEVFDGCEHYPHPEEVTDGS